MSIIATVTVCQQVGHDTFRDNHISREYDESRSISDILSWARAELGRDNVGICDIQFSEYTGKSF